MALNYCTVYCHENVLTGFFRDRFLGLLLDAGSVEPREHLGLLLQLLQLRVDLDVQWGCRWWYLCLLIILRMNVV